MGDPRVYQTMASPALPYGDGRAADRIAGLVGDWLRARERVAVKLRA